MSNKDGATAPENTNHTQGDIDFEAVKADLAAEEETIRQAEARRKARAAQGIVALERKLTVLGKAIVDHQATIAMFKTEHAVVENQIVGLRVLANGEQKGRSRDIGVGKWIREFMRRAVKWTIDEAVANILAERPKTHTDTARKTINVMVKGGFLIVEGPRSRRIYTSREIAIKMGKITVEPKDNTPSLFEVTVGFENDVKALASEGSADGASEPQETAQGQENTYEAQTAKARVKATGKPVVVATQISGDAPSPKPKSTPKPSASAAQLENINMVGDTLGLDYKAISRRFKHIYGKEFGLIVGSEADDFHELLTEEINRHKSSAGMEEGARIRDRVKDALFVHIGEAATKKMTRKEEEWHRAELGLATHEWSIALFQLRETQELFTKRRADRCLFIAKPDTPDAAADAKVETNTLFGDTSIPDHA